MLRVLIALTGSAVDARVLDLAGTLLAGRETDITLLHVVPVPPGDDQGRASTVVLEEYVAAEACETMVAPLVEQLRDSLQQVDREHAGEPRLEPRHLIHRGVQSSGIEHCSIARQRQDSIAFLTEHAQRLRQCGIDAITLTKDSAIGDPPEILRETARHLGVDLVIVGSSDSSHMRQVVEDPGQMMHAPCPVLIVPAPHDPLPL